MQNLFMTDSSMPATISLKMHAYKHHVHKEIHDNNTDISVECVYIVRASVRGRAAKFGINVPRVTVPVLGDVCRRVSREWKKFGK